ncbi:MAG: type IX secretion system plug protein domain-containing protein [Bacteroidota bacterium]
MKFLLFFFIVTIAYISSYTYASPVELKAPPDTLVHNNVFINKTYKKGIKTVLIHKKGWELSFPIIDLNNEEEKIKLSFDELGNNIKDYSWKIIYCNMDWTQSELEPIEYLTGFFEGYIQEYSLSKNTTYNYINYNIDFPNDDVNFEKSGNYIVQIFEQNNPSQIVLTRRFYVINKKVHIKGNIFKQPLQNNSNNQRVNFILNYDNNEIIDPYANLLTTIIKNGESLISTKTILPSKTGINELGFENKKEISFPGGNEFRHFDIKSLKFLSDRIEKIDYIESSYNVILRPDIPKTNIEYNFKNDLNGKSLIKLENSDRSNIEADYCKVIFRLNAPLNLNKGDYYVYGSLSDWKTSDKCKMTFNESKQQYTLTLILKQGYYNYQYVFKSEGLSIDKTNQWFSVEGNYYQTENDYFLLTYYKNPTDLTDEIVGFAKINSNSNF